MDNDRPSLDIKHFGDVCPDENGTFKHSFMAWKLT